MKVCSTPVPFAEPDYRNYDNVKEQAREDAHIKEIKAWLLANGYAGKHTGDIFRHPMADGYACYMFADAGRRSCLIHLPYGDAWNHPDVRYLPKAEILRRIESEKKITALFAEKAAKK